MSQFNVPAYDIERPTGRCALTGRVLQPGEAYMATLVEVDGGPEPNAGESTRGKSSRRAAAALGLKRLDVSMEVWNQGWRPPRLFSYWKSTVPQPNQKKRLFVDDEVLMNIFRRLGESDQPERLAFRFVLGLILMRKRLLRYEGTVQRPGPDGTVQEWWRMVPRGQEEVLEMLNPHLDESRISQVKDQLSEILEADLS